MLKFIRLILFIGWLLLSRGFISWVPFPWAIFPIGGTFFVLVLIPTVVSRGDKRLFTRLSNRIKSQRPSSGVPDLDEILEKQSILDNSVQAETLDMRSPEFFKREDNSIINKGRKRRKFKDKY